MVHSIFKNSTKDIKKSKGFNDTFRGYIADKVLEVSYPATGESVVFNSGIIDDFSDTFFANWSREESYGRMDGIANYSNTTRNMSVRLTLVAESSKVAARNMAQMGKLAQFMYPTYEGGLIKDRPLLKVRLVNLIQDNGSPMIGYITNLSHGFDLKEGVFEIYGIVGEGDGNDFEGVHLYPKYLTINFDFNPLHSQRLGPVIEEAGDAFEHFPYNVVDTTTIPVDTSGTEDVETIDNELPEEVEKAGGNTILKSQDPQ